MSFSDEEHQLFHHDLDHYDTRTGPWVEEFEQIRTVENSPRHSLHLDLTSSPAPFDFAGHESAYTETLDQLDLAKQLQHQSNNSSLNLNDPVWDNNNSKSVIPHPPVPFKFHPPISAASREPPIASPPAYYSQLSSPFFEHSQLPSELSVFTSHPHSISTNISSNTSQSPDSRSRAYSAPDPFVHRPLTLTIPASLKTHEESESLQDQQHHQLLKPTSPTILSNYAADQSWAAAASSRSASWNNSPPQPTSHSLHEYSPNAPGLFSFYPTTTPTSPPPAIQQSWPIDGPSDRASPSWPSEELSAPFLPQQSLLFNNQSPPLVPTCEPPLLFDDTKVVDYTSADSASDASSPRRPSSSYSYSDPPTSATDPRSSEGSVHAPSPTISPSVIIGGVSIIESSAPPPPTPPVPVAEADFAKQQPKKKKDDTKIHPVAQLVASSRARLNAACATSTKKARRRSHTGEEDKLDKRRGLKLTIDHDCSCSSCGTPIARLILRGKREVLDVDYVVTFTCLQCFPIPLETPQETDWDEPTYADTLSAAVDRMQGIEIHARDERPPPPKVRNTTVTGKKRKANDEVLICDVCTREIATGSVGLAKSNEEPEFGVEAICERCCDRYQRCSDCGGGGGVRLGVGKWRSRELFPEGRKTCKLSHLRLGSLNDMWYDVWPVCELPKIQVEGLVGACRDLYTHNMYAGLATPEILEPVTALAKTFDEVQKLTMDSWTVIEPMLREDVESTQSIRRYVALRWSTPTPRKKNKLAASEPKATVSSDEDDGSVVVRKGKNLAGFVIAEMDLTTGSLFLAASTPWATGETYDATTILMQNLLRRIEADLSGLNAQRKLRRQAQYPELDNAWLMMFFKKDSRLMSHLENRRGFQLLDNYLEKYPKSDPAHFAPIRPVFLPPEYLKGWNVLVRKIVKDDDWNARPSGDDKKKAKQDVPPVPTHAPIAPLPKAKAIKAKTASAARKR